MELDEGGDLGVETDDPDFPPVSTLCTSKSEPELFGAPDEVELDGDGDKDFISEAEDEAVAKKESEEGDMQAAFELWLKTRGPKGKRKGKDVVGKTKEKEKVSVIT